MAPTKTEFAKCCRRPRSSNFVKKLYRSRTNRRIAGVCGGLGEYFNLDPTIWRIIFILLLLPGGLPGFVPYIILWFFVPLEPHIKPISAKRVD